MVEAMINHDRRFADFFYHRDDAGAKDLAGRLARAYFRRGYLCRVIDACTSTADCVYDPDGY